MILILSSCVGIFCQKKYSIFLFNNTQIEKKKQIQQTNLQQKIIDLQNQIIELKYENQKLNEYKNIYQSIGKTYNVIAIAEINYINQNNNGHYILASVNKNININNLAVNKDKKMIGRVVENKNNRIKIQLLTNKYSNIPVYIGNSEGIIYGTGENKCRIAYQNLSKIEPKDGDIVITSGAENLTRRGILIGEVYTDGKNKCINADFNYNINQVAIID